MGMKELLYWEMIGVPVIAIVGSLLHFCYKWSGESPLSALFCAVNESVWEHMKIAFWAFFFYAVLELILFRERPGNFLLAKTVGLYLLSVTIPIIFYTYTAILGKHVLWLDILLFILAIFVGQWVSWRILSSAPKPLWNQLAVVPLIVLILAYLTFTFLTPQVKLFQDPQTGGYGLNR